MQYYIGTFKKMNLEVHKNGQVIYDGPSENAVNSIDDKYYSKVLEVTPEKLIVEI